MTSLFIAKGLSVGTYTSPHLERFNERIAWNGEPISDAAFVEIVDAVASIERVMDEAPTVFEILTAAAFRWFLFLRLRFFQKTFWNIDRENGAQFFIRYGRSERKKRASTQSSTSTRW